MVHPEKSVFAPSQEIEYLRFIINSVTMAIRLTTEKKRKIFDFCQEVLLKESFSIRLVSKLLGKFTSSFQAIKYEQLHYRHQQGIIWWKNNILGLFNAIRVRNPSFTITTIASKTGWGAVFNNTSTGDQFSINETLMHINVLELKTILFGLKSLCDHICESHINILFENTTAVHCINNMESCRSTGCNEITKSVCDWDIKRRLWLSSAHISGRLNMEADEEFRKTELKTEWKLNRTIFYNVL